jgi:hypothetical protein
MEDPCSLSLAKFLFGDSLKKKILKNPALRFLGPLKNLIFLLRAISSAF